MQIYGPKGKNILDSTWLLVLLLIPFLEPGGLENYMPTLEGALDIWRMVSFVIILILYLANGRGSILIALFTAIEVVLLLSSILNGIDLRKCVVHGGTIVGFSMLTELYIKRDCRKYFSVTFFFGFLLVLFYFVLYFIFSSTFGPVAGTDYIFGHKNTYDTVTIPFMAIACLCYEFTHRNRWAVILLYVMASITFLTIWSATGLVAWFCMMAYVIIFYKKRTAKLLNSYFLFTAFLVLDLAIVVFRVQDAFAFIINDILGKSLTFTGRTLVWDRTIPYIKEAPLLGHGVVDSFWYMPRVGTVHPHNTILSLLMQGGVVVLVLYSAVVILVARKLFKYRDNSIAGIVTMALFCMFVAFLMEALEFAVWLYGLFVIAYNISSVIRQAEAAAQAETLPDGRRKRRRIRFRSAG